MDDREKQAKNKDQMADKEQTADRNQAITFLIVLAVLILLIWLLGPPPGEGDLQVIPGGQDAFQCVYYVDGQPSETPPLRVISNNSSPYFVDGQVIVSGPVQEINEIREELEGQFQLQPLELCDLRYQGVKFGTATPAAEPTTLTSRDVTITVPAPPRGRVWANQVAVLFQVDVDQLADAVQAINAAGNGSGVFADPNYLTGPRASSSCTGPPEPVPAPFEVGGSPFEVGGSPFEVGGSPAGSALAPANADVFWHQWVFTQTNIVTGTQLLDDRIRVAVFDAIPKWGECDCDCDCNRPFDHPVHIGSEPNEQEFLIHIFPNNRQANDLQPVASDPVDVSEHGVFVSGLINAVSGVREIDLYEVLNGAGCGDLQTLYKTLSDYNSRILSENDGSMQGVIINLSLGVHQPEDPATEGLPQDIHVLRETLSNAHQAGALIVAAAGNNSANDPPPHLSDLPADYNFVIGVAATNIDSNRSCYSNRGKIAAPAGDGGAYYDLTPDQQKVITLKHPEDLEKSCLPLAIACQPGDTSCKYGVVSYSPSSPTRYRFWAGTSFAAPLVSGIVALLLDGGHPVTGIQGIIDGWVVKPPTAQSEEPPVIDEINSLPTPVP